MKKSIYNNGIVITAKRCLLYNAYTNMYVIVKRELYDSYQSMPPASLQREFPIFYEQLTEAGCLIEEEVDEVARLRERIKRIDNQPDSYNLTVNPTLNCNFRCWYCYEEHLPKSKMHPDILERVKRHITFVAVRIRPKFFNMGFFGGEPLLYYADVVRPLLQHMQATCKKYDITPSVGFTSNGYLITDAMVSELKELNVSSFQITLDGNRESHNKTRFPAAGTDTYTKITENIKKLVRAGIFVILRINYTADNLAGTKDIIQDFRSLNETEKQNLRVDFQRVWQDRDKKNASTGELLDECIDAFEAADLPVYAQTIDQVWSPCYADKCNQALINHNGDVYKCTAREFNETNRLGKLNEEGRIEWDETKMRPRRGIRFTKEVCHSCRIAPLCGGTCTQRILDSGNVNRCLRGLTEEGKDRIVLNKFYYTILKQA